MINIRKSTVYLYTSYEWQEKEMKKISQFTTASRSIKYCTLRTTTHWKKKLKIKINERLYLANGSEGRETDPHTGNWNLTKMSRQFSGERTVFLTNSAGKIGYPYAKKKNFISHHWQKGVKTDHRPKYKTQNFIQLLEKKKKIKSLWPCARQRFMHASWANLHCGCFEIFYRTEKC